jgi:hypothetical protein
MPARIKTSEPLQKLHITRGDIEIKLARAERAKESAMNLLSSIPSVNVAACLNVMKNIAYWQGQINAWEYLLKGE